MFACLFPQKRYIREHRKKNHYRNYAPSYVSHIEDAPSPTFPDFSNYYQPGYFGNGFKETHGHNSWDTYTEPSEPFHQKYNLNPNSFAGSLGESVYSQQPNIADLIELTTASPQRVPVLASAVDYRFMQSTEGPLEYASSDVKPLEFHHQLQPAKKRKKNNNYGHYEVVEAVDDSARGPSKPKIAPDAYQSALESGKYVRYSSSVAESRPHHVATSSSYGKRKKIKKSRRNQQ